MYIYSSKTMSFTPIDFVEDMESIDKLQYTEVSEEQHAEFFDSRPSHLHIPSANVKGFPIWLLKSATKEEEECSARSARNSFLKATDVMVSVPDYPLGDVEDAQLKLKKARTAFRDWPSQKGWPNIVAPELEPWLLQLAVKNGYKVI